MVCIDLLVSCVKVDDFDVSGQIVFILYFSECAAHAGSKEYPLDMVCVNFLASCRKVDDFSRFL